VNGLGHAKLIEWSKTCSNTHVKSH